MKRVLIPFLKVALAGCLIYYLVASEGISFREFGALGERWPWFCAAVGLFGLVFVLAAWRWKVLLSAQEIRYGLGNILGVTLIGLFFNQFMLGSTGGDVVKAYYVATDYPDRKAAGILTVVFDRLLGLVVLLSVAGLAVLFNLGFVTREVVLTSLAVTIWISIATVLLVGYLFYAEKVRRQPWVRALLSRLPFQKALKTLSDTVYIYKYHPRHVLMGVALSAGIHLSVVAAHVLLYLALTPALPPAGSFFLLVPMAQIAMAIPLTPGSVGTGEAAYEKLFQLGGFTRGSEVCILLRLTYFFWALVGCAIYLARRRKYRKAEPREKPRNDLEEELPSDAVSPAERVRR